MTTKITLILCLISCNICSCQTSSTDTCANKKDLFLYLNVDELPSFKYENMTAMEYIYKNLKWPNEFDGQGTVIVSFIVKKDGNVCNIKIEKSLCPECDKEVKRVIDSMPKWQHGKLNNRPVDVTLYLPILFRLSYE